MSHFTKLNIVNYKLFKDFKIDKLNKINIFAGMNNSGKTTLLEAVYFLTIQNDIYKIVDLFNLRKKTYKRLINSFYQFKKNIKILGMLNSKNVVFDFKLVNTKESINKFNY